MTSEEIAQDLARRSRAAHAERLVPGSGLSRLAPAQQATADERRLIVYAGPNGAGKSTLRDSGDDGVDLVIDADRIARVLADNSHPDANWEAGRQAIALFQKALKQGQSLSLETTLTGQTPLRRMAEARAAGYHIELRYLALHTPERHIARVQQRVARGGHFIPADTIVRRYGRSLANLPEAFPFTDYAFVFDNSEAEIHALLRAEGGCVRQQESSPPAWFQSRLPQLLTALAKRAENAP